MIAPGSTEVRIFSSAKWKQTAEQMESIVAAVKGQRAQALSTIASLVSIIYSWHGPNCFITYFFKSPELKPLRDWLDPQPGADPGSMKAYVQTLLVLGGTPSGEVAKIN